MKEGGRGAIEAPTVSRGPMGPMESSGSARGHREVESGGQEYGVSVCTRKGERTGGGDERGREGSY